MTFEKWWEKNEPVINRVLGKNTDFMKIFFENAFLFGKEHGKMMGADVQMNGSGIYNQSVQPTETAGG